MTVSMNSKRLQILLTLEQGRRLREEARLQGRSVASLIREAIDARYGPAGREQRLAAVEAIAAMTGGKFVAPDDLDRIIADERAANFRDL
ncbi:MAG: hypothetical protein J2P45_18020 [Candidatus Dormibacteraeota bacterium]|nr:hypothetical protein [Candidatus Dormibacteraeota bacterium]